MENEPAEEDRKEERQPLYRNHIRNDGHGIGSIDRNSLNSQHHPNRTIYEKGGTGEFWIGPDRVWCREIYGSRRIICPGQPGYEQENNGQEKEGDCTAKKRAGIHNHFLVVVNGHTVEERNNEHGPDSWIVKKGVKGDTKGVTNAGLEREQEGAGRDEEDACSASRRGDFPQNDKRSEDQKDRGEREDWYAKGEISGRKCPVKKNCCHSIDDHLTVRAGKRPGPRGGMPVKRIKGTKIRVAARKEYPARKNGGILLRRTFTERLYMAWLMAPIRARTNHNIIVECYRVKA